MGKGAREITLLFTERSQGGETNEQVWTLIELHGGQGQFLSCL